MTDQETFDKVVTGLAAQGFQRARGYSRGGTEVCVYRAADGKKCAFGHLIPDELYKPEFEGKLSFQLLDRNGSYPHTKSDELIALGLNEPLVDDLQAAHDGARSPDSMRNALKAVAHKYDLTLPEVLSGGA